MITKIGAARLPEHWQATADELAAGYPCDRLAKTDVRALTRAIDIEAPVPVTFRWLCQLRVAPYSYDWIDNRGRTSPRVLTPGLDRLKAGQEFGVGTLVDFARTHHDPRRTDGREVVWPGGYDVPRDRREVLPAAGSSFACSQTNPPGHGSTFASTYWRGAT
jgi:hypothetical protein